MGAACPRAAQKDGSFMDNSFLRLLTCSVLAPTMRKEWSVKSAWPAAGVWGAVAERRGRD